MQLPSSKHTCAALAILSGLFLLRVVAEFVERLFADTWAPNFTAWSSGTIDYRLLLASQVIVFSAMAVGVLKVATLKWPRGYSLSIRLFAQIYFVIMLIRLIVAVSGASDLYWFQLPLPAFFHLVIAAYLYGFTYHLEINLYEAEGMV